LRLGIVTSIVASNILEVFLNKLTNPISLALLVLTACVVTSCTVTGSSSSTSDGSSTAGVLCDYNYSALNSSASVNLTSTSKWSCSSTIRTLAGNGVPDHEVGTFPNDNNPNTISAQTASATYTLNPVATSTATTLGGPSGALGYALNSVKFDPDTGGTCNDDGSSCSLIGGTGNWRMEALGQKSFNFGTDDNGAHIQPDGEYHYHGIPAGLVTKLNKGKAMTLIGWAADGFPIYARYGYTTATDATSSIKVMTGSYKTKATPDANRPATSMYAMGTFKQDYEYVAGSGDLDECNGRTGVTPEFPKGIYHYYATETYPFVQRCVKGKVTVSQQGPPPGGAPPK
jgi:YHYH protein